MKKIVLKVLLFALLLYGAGCIQQPNDNLYYADCCEQNVNVYTCEAQKSGGDYVTDSRGYVVLDGCGQCKYWDRGTGAVYADGNEPLRDSNGDLLNPKDCENNCNFQQADCTNSDGENTCYGLNDKTIKIAPICANDTPNPCVSNECSAMVCYKTTPSVRLAANQQDLQTQTKKNSALSKDSKLSSKGLYEKTCEFLPMDVKTANILKKEGSFVNSFRLGIQGTFSDYDRARYYMPPTDLYCGNAQQASVVDRFTRYLDGESKLPQFSSSYKAPLHKCIDGGKYWYCDPAVDKDLSRIKFYDVDYDTHKGAEYACARICSMARFPQCEDNSKLITQNVTVSPPNAKDEVTQPFVNVAKYYEILDEQYPIPEDVDNTPDSKNPLDYYHKLPTITEGMSDKQIRAAVDELLKPGPAGARVFECSEDTDCMSSNCDKGIFSRSACVDKEGRNVDCGCRLIDNCNAQYLCEIYKPSSRARTICNMNKLLCEWTATPALVCDYDITAMDEAVALDKEGKLTKSGKVKDMSEFSKSKEPIEIVNKQKLTYENKCYNKEADKWEDIVRACPEGCYENKDAKTPNEECICDNGKHYSPKEETCKTQGYKLDKYYFWVDDTSGFNNFQWLWYHSFALAPSKQVVWTGTGGGIGAYLITKRDMTFEQLEDKFPLINACNLKNNEDIYKVDPSKYNGTKEQALGIRGEVYDSKKDEYWVWDSRWYINRTYDPKTAKVWLGDCQVDTDGVPLVITYGVCQPCGSLLTYAYQNVSMQLSDSGEISGYCPSNCKISGYAATNYKSCYCPDTEEQFNIKAPDAPATNPEFGFLSSKISEYQDSQIIPILDIRDYQIRTGGELYGGVEYDVSKKDCDKMGGEYHPRDCAEYSSFSCIKYSKAYCDTTTNTKADYLLRYLQNNRSSVILLVANISTDCADPQDQTSEDGPQCKGVIAKIKNASLACPDCTLALEYPKLISAKTDDTYPDELKNALTKFSGAGKADAVEYDELSFGPRWVPKNTAPAQMSDVDILILNFDLGTIDTNSPETIDERLQYTINLSRKILQHVNYQTLYKMQIKKDGATQQNGAYMQKEMYKSLFDKQKDMVLSGIIGILLPPLDNADTNGDEYSQEEYGRLMGRSTDTLEDVKNKDLPFCPAQMGTSTFLHPDVTVALQKSIAKDVCKCNPCSDFDKMEGGACTTEEQLCLDGATCQEETVDSAGQSSYKFTTKNGGLKCEPSCFRSNKMSACKDSPSRVTCRKMESSNDPLTYCNGPADITDGCDIITFAVSDLETDAFFRPYRAELLAGLPVGKKCYIEEGNFTYTALLSTKTSSTPLVYPKYGSTTTDCGIANIEDEDLESCQQSKIPLPIRKSAWICS